MLGFCSSPWQVPQDKSVVWLVGSNPNKFVTPNHFTVVRDLPPRNFVKVEQFGQDSGSFHGVNPLIFISELSFSP
jgi:hypothetical protein